MFIGFLFTFIVSFFGFSAVVASEAEPIGSAVETGRGKTLIVAPRGESSLVTRRTQHQTDQNEIALDIQSRINQLKEILRSGIVREKGVFSFFEKNYSKNYPEEQTPGFNTLIIREHERARDNNINNIKEILKILEFIENLQEQERFTEHLDSLFHTLLENRHASLSKYYERFTPHGDISGGISTHPDDMANQALFKRFMAQAIIDRYALYGLVMQGLYGMVKDKALLPEKTQQLLSCCSVFKKYLTRESKEVPNPILCMEDVKAFQTKYYKFFLKSVFTSETRGVIPITGKARRALKRQEKKERKQEAREIRKSMREEEQEEIYQQLLAAQLAKQAKREDKECLDVPEKPLKRIVATWNAYPPMPSTPPRYVPQEPREKKKTRGLVDASTVGPFLDNELPAEQNPPSIILDEETSRFFRHSKEDSRIKTYENFKRLFKEFPGEIYESTGSSHFKLYCLNPINNSMHVGSIWNYHNGMDRFDADSIKHLLFYVERSGRTPWRPTTDGDAFYLIKFLPESIRKKEPLQLIFDYYNPGFISLSAIGKERFLNRKDIPGEVLDDVEKVFALSSSSSFLTLSSSSSSSNPSLVK